jgi:cysteine desulfurase
VYLDAAAGAPLHPVAREALLAALADGWADPARLYREGRQADLLLAAARESLAEQIGARPDEVSFVSNGTVALHAAVLGALSGQPGHPLLVHTAVEHSAVLHAAEHYVAAGGSAVSVPVREDARVEEHAFVSAATDAAAAVAVVQAANHEVGTCQPVTAIAQRLPGLPVVVDATHVLSHGHAPSGWSVLTGDARMWGAPTLGLLAVRTGQRWRSPYPADEREYRRIPGIPLVPVAVAAAATLRAVADGRAERAARLSALVDRIRATVPDTVPDVQILGDPVDRLPHIVTFSCLYADGEALLTGLDRHGISVSSGSSCTSSTLVPSHVLVAMGALTSGNIRVSLHDGSTDADVDHFLAVLPGVVAQVRAELGAAGL